jgi:hypothetical protein
VSEPGSPPRGIAIMTPADDAYTERNRLVALLAWLYDGAVGRTDIPGWAPEWHGCVYIDLPTGQVSFHFHDRDAGLFAGLPPFNGVWDGHTTEEKWNRVARLGRHARAAWEGAYL